VFDVVDALPNESTQWSDSDNDGYGDNPDGAEGDDCVLTYGTSHIDRLGCPDNDNDGYANTFDDCPDVAGASSQGVLGCPDSDGDGYADVADECPDDATKWEYGTVCIEEVNDEENKNESGDITNEEDTLVGQCTCPDGSIGMLVGPADDDGTDDGCFCGNSDAEISAKSGFDTIIQGAIIFFSVVLLLLFLRQYKDTSKRKKLRMDISEEMKVHAAFEAEEVSASGGWDEIDMKK
jgi:hypothetical protein